MKVGIVGGGHNGLVLAGYLAKDNFDVTVFEARHRVGGLCVNEEIFPGHIISTVATYFGMLRRQIIEDLELEDFGLEAYLTDPIAVLLLPDGGFTFAPRDSSRTKISVPDLTAADLEGWKRFWSDMAKAAQLMSPLYHQPDSTQQELIDILRADGLHNFADYVFDGSLLELTDLYFKNRYLKAAAAACAPGFACDKGTVYSCMHYGQAQACGVQGGWGLVKGGMGAVSESLE